MRTLPAAVVAAAVLLACGDSGDTTGTPKQVPPPPASVSAKIENNNLVLTWADVPEATSYNVYMAAEAGVKRVNYSTLTGNMFHPGEAHGKFDHPPGLDANMKYYLVVTSVNDAGESAESCEVGALIATSLGESC
jgi:hypothetical protein